MDDPKKRSIGSMTGFLAMLGLVATAVFWVGINPQSFLWEDPSGPIENTVEIDNEFSLTVLRLGYNKPIITKDMFRNLGVASEGENINGPSVIRVPDWIPDAKKPNERANYYMYFARHGRDKIGDYIRMAWAEDIEGPWHLFGIGKTIEPGNRGALDLGADGSIQLGNAYLRLSVGSPDVVVDNLQKRIVMYFHAARTNGKAAAFVSTSPYGLNFNDSLENRNDGHGIRATPIGGPYFRTFEHKGQMYAFSNFGFLYRAPKTVDAALTDDLWAQSWERIDGPLRQAHDGSDDGDGDALEEIGNPRHLTVVEAYDKLWVFYSRRDDAPERILLSIIDPGKQDWQSWKATFPPHEILTPALEWEGADLRVTASKNGPGRKQRALRDPYVFVDTDGRWYLFYTGRGEEAIGVARLTSVIATRT